MIEPKFCFQCGKALQMRYPGCYDKLNPPERILAQLALPPDERPEWFTMHPHGDPEDGPAAMRCPDGHERIEDEIEQEVLSEAADAFDDLLQEIRQGGDDPNDPAPAGVRLAAEVLLTYRENQRLKDEAYMLAVEAQDAYLDNLDDDSQDEDEQESDGAWEFPEGSGG